MRTARATALACCTLLCGCGACEPDKTAGGVPDSAATAASSDASEGARTTAIAPSGRPHWNQPPAGVNLPCRAIAIEGDVKVDGAPLAPQAPVPPDGWVAIGVHGKLVAKDPRTSRETSFDGPGRVRACVGADEESWIASGTFASSPGVGEAPGTEQWVVTPFGVVRYAVAAMRLAVDASEARCEVTSGTAWAWTPSATKDERGAGADLGNQGWQRIERSTLRLHKGPSAQNVLDRCASLAAAAHDLAARVLSGEGRPSQVVSQVSERRLARAACALARLRADTDSNADMARAAASADLSWRTLALSPVAR